MVLPAQALRINPKPRLCTISPGSGRLPLKWAVAADTVVSGSGILGEIPRRLNDKQGI
jgi:hypothetical protein